MSWRGANGLYVVRKLGLTANLGYCIDPGDAASYDGSAQTIYDLSGNLVDFYLGPTSGSEATDPTFNGTAGRLSKDEYFDIDAAPQYLKLTAGSNPAWVTAVHGDNALATFAGWNRFKSSAGIQVLAGTHASGAAKGFRLMVTTDNTFRLTCGNGTSSVLAVNSGIDLDSVVGDGNWFFWSASLNEAGNTALWRINSTISTTAFTYTSPTTDAAQGVLTLGASPLGGVNLIDGSAIGPQWGWSRALSLAEMAVLFDATRGRFQI